ncbi:vanadium-dependent haloperoxidase [Actinoplanes sp. NPDC024001]|uniref:vanadium-dependent haloperoxidase n=1 Tax=Actinoplanes sp. NPDC024001 TaxID=3154598 RepID=UPI0033F6DAE3
MAHRFRRTGILLTALVLTAAPALTPAAQAAPATRSDAVITWNLHAQTAIYETARQSPTAGLRSFAMVQGAVYDAVNAIAGSPYEPYLVAPRSRPRDSVPAAVAAAAHRVLVSLFPAQATTLAAQYDAALAAVPDGSAERGGVAVGEAAAAAMIESRRDDGAFSDATWPVGDQPGQWRPTPPGFIQAGAWYADLKPFVLRDPKAYRVPAPPALSSATWARELNEVQSLGSAASTTRTADQTEAAIWWDDPRMVEWEIKRNLAKDHRLSALQTARLFAMVEIATADALISCYSEKKRWAFWRPVTAIPLAGTDGNPATTADESWTPLRTTAPSAEYPSGHSCFTASIMTVLRAFFGRDRVAFHAYSADSGTTRHYTSFAAATAELAEARIWAGVHYRFATVHGIDIGRAVARDVLRTEFGPRHD